MLARIRKSGHSYVITIPPLELEAAGVKVGDTVEISRLVKYTTDVRRPGPQSEYLLHCISCWNNQHDDCCGDIVRGDGKPFTCLCAQRQHRTMPTHEMTELTMPTPQIDREA